MDHLNEERRATLAFVLDRCAHLGRLNLANELGDRLIAGFAEERYLECSRAGEYDGLRSRVDRIMSRSATAVAMDGADATERGEERRAAIAFVLDRLGQYYPSRGMRVFAKELVTGLAEGRHIASFRRGDYRDLLWRVDSMRRAPPSEPWSPFFSPPMAEA